jgi:predicted nucleotidyltransferase
MIIEQNTELKAMSILVAKWYKGFSAYELASEAKISVPMAYSILKKLENKKIVAREDKKIRLNFNNLFSYTFKLMHDSERMLELPEKSQDKINHVFNVFAKEYGQNLMAFLIFGSVASNETTDKSDIDLLAIVKSRKDIDYRKRGLLELGNLNIIEKEEREFEKDYLSANDLVLNALMNGIIIFDNGIIRFFLNKSLPKPSNEVIMQKRERLEVLKNRLFSLLKDKNYKELAEQLRIFIIEKARIIFLEKGIIPSSKKYIMDNLDKADKQLYRDYIKLSEKNAGEILKKNV